METSLTFYERARVAVEALLAFLTSLYDKQPLCVTYFDEAHELQILFWILLRLLSHQPMTTSMWYVFMGTKLSSYLTLPLRDCVSSISPPCAHLSLMNNSLFSTARRGSAKIASTTIYCIRL